MDENIQPETQQLFNWWNSGGSDAKFEGMANQGGGTGGSGMNAASVQPLSVIDKLGSNGKFQKKNRPTWGSNPRPLD